MKTYLDLVTEAKPLVDFIDMEQTDAALAQGCELIDVREESEFNAGHLPGALHMSRGVIEGRMGANPRFARHDTHIMLYCRRPPVFSSTELWSPGLI